MVCLVMKRIGFRIAFATTFSILAACEIARAEVGVTKTEILLGESTNLTGSNSERAVDLHRGAQLYFDKVNAKGGIHGRKIKLIAVNDDYEPEKTLTNVKKLLNEDHVFALFQIYGTPNCRAILPMIQSKDVPLIAATTGAEFMRRPIDRNLFNIRAGYAEEANEMVRFLTVDKKTKSIGILSQDDSYGTSGMSGVQKAAASAGIKLAGEATFRRNSADVTLALKTLKDAGPKAILLWAFRKEGSEFVNQYATTGLTPIFIGSSTLATSGFARDIDKYKGEVYITLGVPLADDMSYEIVQRFRKDIEGSKVEPELAALEGYVNAAIFSEALERAGPALTRQALRDAFNKKMSDVNLGGLKLSYSENEHQGLMLPFLVKVQGGKFIKVN
jgi:branched-chain amino acid transport system substrate-binding protein